MFGRNHSEKTLKKQKEKAKGRFTLEWFIERYGQNNGQKKYDERRSMLTNRKLQYSFPNPKKGISRGPMSEEVKQKISQSKIKMQENRENIRNDLKSGLFSSRQLAEKYGIALSSVKYIKARL